MKGNKDKIKNRLNYLMRLKRKVEKMALLQSKSSSTLWKDNMNEEQWQYWNQLNGGIDELKRLLNLSSKGVNKK